MIISIDIILEVAATVLNLIFLFFIIKEKKIGWIYGVLASALSIYLFYRIRLYAEAILYVYYVVIGAYGYYTWSSAAGQIPLNISTWNLNRHALVVLVGIVFAMVLGFILDEYTDATNAYLDAVTTVFSFLATFMEARKILSVWFFWIAINSLTIGLYLNKGLEIYAGLTVIYLAASFVGYNTWKKKMVNN